MALSPELERLMKEVVPGEKRVASVDARHYTHEEANKMAADMAAFLDGILEAPEPQPIDWRKVAARLRATADNADIELRHFTANPHERVATATVMAICNTFAAAIEDGLS